MVQCCALPQRALPQRVSAAIFLFLLSISSGEAKSFDYLSEKDSTGIELKHFIGKHMVQRFTVADGVARFKVGRGKSRQEFALRGFQLQPKRLESSYRDKADRLNVVTSSNSVDCPCVAIRWV